MRIFDREPESWPELETLVGKLFTELGCAVFVQHVTDLSVRPGPEVDVWVEDPETTPASLYICECKFWARNVDQGVVREVRSLVADIGPNRAFIISKVGFQKGVVEAAKATPLTLCTFEGLQEMFFDRWRKSMAKRHWHHADAVFPCWDHVAGVLPGRHWNEIDTEILGRLKEAYRPFVELASMDVQRSGELELPMTLPVLDKEWEQAGQVTLDSYRAFYDFLEQRSETAKADFRRLLGLDGTGDPKVAFRRLHDEPLATDAIADGRLPPLPRLTLAHIEEFDQQLEGADERLHELALNSRSVHRGPYLRFVRASDWWFALRNQLNDDGTAMVTAQFENCVFRVHQIDDGAGTDKFLVWEFSGQEWKLDIDDVGHSTAYDDQLNLSQNELDDDRNNPWPFGSDS